MWSRSQAVLYLATLTAFISECYCEEKITASFTDPITNISFQRFFGAKTSFAFGIALPETPNNSFIGQMSFPLVNGSGWGGWSLTDDMEGPLLMAAWSDGTNVVSSFRQAANEDDNPPEVTGSFRTRPIAAGTSVNSSFLTYTFLCEGCLDTTLGLGAAATASTVKMGWALGSKSVDNAGTSAGVLNFHDKGFGGFSALLGQARNAQFDTWVALAGTPLAPAPGATPIRLNAGEEEDDDSGDDSDDDDDSL